MRCFDKLRPDIYPASFLQKKTAQGAGGSSPCRAWAEPTFLVPQHFQESTASTEGARSADLTVKNEVFRQAETGYLSSLFFAEKKRRVQGDHPPAGRGQSPHSLCRSTFKKARRAPKVQEVRI